jgi:glucokinase
MIIQNDTIGIDIGGTKIAIGLVDGKGSVIKKVQYETVRNKSFQDAVDKIIIGLKKLGVKKVGRIGVGIAGQIDSGSGIIVHSPNIPSWKNVPVISTIENKVGREFKKKINFKVKIANDANCFVLGEAKYGAGKDLKNVLGLTLGTGLGGGLIINGKIYKGQGYAIEPGHFIIEEEGRKCSCSMRGCLENYVAGRAIEDEYYKRAKKRLSAIEIEKEAIKEGRKSKAHNVYKEAGKYLGIGISNLVNILDPDVVIIGGGLGRSDLLFKEAKKEASKNIFFKKRKVNIKKAKLGHDAGIVGAAELVRQIINIV